MLLPVGLKSLSDVYNLWCGQNVQADEQGWITATATLGCIVGALPSGWLSDRVGRRACILVLALVFTAGAILQLCAVSPRPRVSSVGLCWGMSLSVTQLGGLCWGRCWVRSWMAALWR